MGQRRFQDEIEDKSKKIDTAIKTHQDKVTQACQQALKEIQDANEEIKEANKGLKSYFFGLFKYFFK